MFSVFVSEIYLKKNPTYFFLYMFIIYVAYNL